MSERKDNSGWWTLLFIVYLGLFGWGVSDIAFYSNEFRNVDVFVLVLFVGGWYVIYKVLGWVIDRYIRRREA
jgi:hypothetical protein